MAVIDKLDIRRAQVQVEALIVEVDINKSANLGVQWLLFGQGNSTVPAGIISESGLTWNDDFERRHPHVSTYRKGA